MGSLTTLAAASFYIFISFPDAPQVVSFDKEYGGTDKADDNEIENSPLQSSNGLSAILNSATTILTRQTLLHSPQPMLMSHQQRPPSQQLYTLEPYLVTPDYHRYGSTAENDEDGDNDMTNDSLEMSIDEHCFLPDVERHDCRNPVALTLLYNNKTHKEDWHYRDMLDVANYEAIPAPIAEHPPLPSVISRPQPIRPTPAVQMAFAPPPFWTAMMASTTGHHDNLQA